MICHKKKWMVICGDGFVENDWGATMFCRQLGFSDGAIRRVANRVEWSTLRSSVYDALQVGVCQQSDGYSFNEKCTGGKNTHKILDAKLCAASYDYKIECFKGKFYSWMATWFIS